MPMPHFEGFKLLGESATSIDQFPARGRGRMAVESRIASTNTMPETSHVSVISAGMGTFLKRRYRRILRKLVDANSIRLLAR